jgi:hypothetical protein
LATIPTWLALFAPLPDDAVVERKPVASPELIAGGQADAIAGWESITAHLSDPAGMRHVLITLDGNGTLISGADMVLFQREEQRGRDRVTIYDQENVGGRFEEDGSFRGTRWITHTEQIGDDDENAHATSLPSPPTEQDVASLRATIDDVIRRAPGRREGEPR